MTSDNRDYNMGAFSERLAAQTEAYVEFSNALVKIIESIASIRDKVIDTNDALKDDFKTLIDKLNELLFIITKFSIDTASQYTILNKDIYMIVEKIQLFNVNLNKLIESNDLSDDKLNQMMLDLIDYSKSTIKKITDNNEDLINERESHNINLKNILVSIDLKLNFIDEKINKLMDIYNKGKLVFWLFGSVIGIFTVLTQFNIISFVWKH